MSATNVPFPHPPGGPTGPAHGMGAAGGGVVPNDLPCRKCSYNLRGLPLDGRCPECGAAVGLSVQGNLLRFSNPVWVRTLQRGARFIVFGVAVIFFGLIIAIAFGAARGAAGGGSQPLLLALSMLIGYGLIVVGSWLLTEPDPSGIGEDEYGTSRKVIRVALGVGILNAFLNFVTSVAPVPPGVFTAVQGLGIVFGIVGLVGFFAQLQYLKKIAMRIPDERIAGRARFLMYAIPIGYGLMLVLSFATALLVRGGAGGPGLAVPLGCGVGIIAIAVLVFFIMYLLMIERIGKRFGEAAAAAEQSWAAVGGAG